METTLTELGQQIAAWIQRTYSNMLVMNADIIPILCDEFHVSREQLMSRSRLRPIVEARQIGMFLNYTFSDDSLLQTGVKYNHHHTTVTYALKTVKALYHTNQQYREKIHRVFARFGLEVNQRSFDLLRKGKLC